MARAKEEEEKRKEVTNRFQVSETVNKGACVQCEHSHSCTQVPFVLRRFARPVWMRSKQRRSRTREQAGFSSKNATRCRTEHNGGCHTGLVLPIEFSCVELLGSVMIPCGGGGVVPPVLRMAMMDTTTNSDKPLSLSARRVRLKKPSKLVARVKSLAAV